MIYQAILVACLASAPTECRTHEMLIESSPIPYTAFLEAQNQAAKWLAERPGLKQKSLTIHPGQGA